LFDPVGTHPSVVVSAVAARSLSKAQAQIAKYALGDSTRAYGSYADLLADPNIDAVYIPLPNGLHCEWAIKAMEAGKHVLIEKAIASNANQAENIRKCSAATGKVALEAFHWLFYPAAHTIKAAVESGKYGNVQSITARLCLDSGTLAEDDIRFSYSLAGGASLDLAYVFSGATYFASPSMKDSKYKVLEATARLNKRDPKIDDAMRATFSVEYPGQPAVTCSVEADLNQSRLFGLIPKFWNLSPLLVIELEKARIEFPNFPGPWVYHKITTTEKDSTGALTGKKHTEKCHVNGPVWGSRGAAWWTTYRYQLEAFAERVREAESTDGGNRPSKTPWVSLDNSVKLMELIDSVYEKAGLPKRGL